MNTTPTSVHTLIIGAGAAGLFCAMHIGKAFKGTANKVLVIDHANKAGKKILMSGGGKCNFTNYFVEPENYLSTNPHFCKSALSRYTNWEFISLVEKHGIAYEERKHGQLFCLHSAKDILNMLLSECEQAGVNILCKTSIASIQTNSHHSTGEIENTAKKSTAEETVTETTKTGFVVHTSKGEIYCENLVIATGGLSIPTMGATGFGYEVATQFGHTLIPRRAGLVPFTFTDDMGEMTKRLSGNAIDVTATSQNHAAPTFTEAMLFTHRGLSGPAMLQISNYWQPSETFWVDLAPQVDLADWLLAQKQHKPKSLIRSVLNEHFPKNVVLALQTRLWQPLAEKPLADIANQHLQDLGSQLNHWQLKPAGTEGYRTAEVTLGGINVQDISSKTMQSKRQPKLYFIGEVLDVTGWLGGYNFQWAWSSAYVCAESISNA